MLNITISVITKVLLGLLILISLLPAIVVVVISFSSDSSAKFPPEEYGVDHYVQIFSEGPWVDAMIQSVRIGLLAALLSLALGILISFIAVRSPLRARWAIFAVAVASMLIPVAGYGVALYGTFSSLHILGTEFGIVISHVLLALPVAAIFLATGLAKIPRDLDLVAMTLGASRLQATITITGRLLLPTIGAAFIIAFLTSFDEAVFVSFLGGLGISTLPKVIFESVRFGLDPTVTAIGSLLIALNALLVSLRLLIQSKDKTA